jgi:hypothetical protein
MILLKKPRALQAALVYFRPMTLRLALIACAAPCLCAQQRFEFNTVKQEFVEARLRRVAVKDSEREATLRAIFEEVGCAAPRLQEQAVKHARLPNVICTLPGETDGIVIASGHFDHVELGKGAVDDWSGVSLLPSLYQVLAMHPRKHTFVFIGFTSEESGLVGSQFYVKSLTPEERSRIRAVVNLECLGLSSTKVWLSGSDKKLAGILAGVARVLQAPLQAVDVQQVGSDDSQAFAAKKIPVVSIHSVTQETLRVLHSPRDDLKAINLEEYYQTYRLTCAYLAYLDGALE